MLEVIIATAVMATGILLMSMTWSGTFQRMRKTQTNIEVVALLERKIAELDVKYRNKPLESIPESEEDNFGDEYPQYSWKMESRDFVMPDLTGFLTAQAGGADQLTLTTMKTFTDYLSKAVKEVKVTVIFKPPSGRPQTYSITTLYVDYNKQIPMPNLGGG